VLDGAIIEANDTNEAERKISSLQLNKQLWEHQTLHGCRVVLSRHTYSHRMQQILNTLGLVDSKVEERVKTLREIPKLSMGQIKNKISKMIGDWND